MIIYLTEFDWTKQCCICGKPTADNRFYSGYLWWFNKYIKITEDIKEFYICKGCIHHINFDGLSGKEIEEYIAENMPKTTGYERVYVGQN
jgi:hypothetical protein